MPSSSSQQQWYKRTGSFSGSGGAAASSALMSVGSASLRLVAGTISTGYSTISTAAAVASSAVGGATGASGGGDGASFSSDQKEKVLWARFDTLEVSASGGAARPPRAREVLLLGYAVGFQVWDVTDPGEVQELLSLRDVTVRCVQPLPAPLEPDPSSSPMKGQRPILAVVPCSQASGGGGGGDPSSGPRGGGGGGGGGGGTIELHSAASQALVRILTFHSRVVSVRASPRILAVALETQVLGFDARSLDKLFTAMTFPTPGSGPAPHEGHLWAAPLALGHRWLAYASNQPVKNPSGYATLQSAPGAPVSSSAPGGSNHHHHPLSYSHHESYSHHRHGSGGSGGGGGGGGSGGSSYRGYVKNVASQAAAASGKQLKAGISWVGDTSYKLLSSQYASWTAGSSSSSSSFKRPSSDGGDFSDAPGMMGRSPDSSFGGYFGSMGGGGGGGGSSSSSGTDPLQAQVAGTVMVCDVMRRHTAVAHFRAHTSPLALLAWDPSGLLLVTASVYGHSVNVFQICPPAASGGGGACSVSNGGGGGGGDGPGAALHLYKLSRGITPALITDAVFSCSGEWLAVSSGRGTTHLFHLGSEQQGGAGGAAGHNQQQRPLMVSSSSSAASAPPPLQHLSPVGRLRSSRGWAARVPGAPLAAAAAGLYAGGPGTAGPSVGAIAARFTCSSSSSSAASSSGRKPGGGSYQGEVLLAHEQLHQQQHPQGSGPGGAPSSEELLIAGPEGTLTRYLIGLSSPDGAPGGSHPGADADDEGMMFGSSPASMSSAFSMEGNDPDASELASEVVSRLDVCRRLAWPERGNLASEAPSVPSPQRKAPSSASAAALGGGAALSEFPRVADTEEERHSFVANAEICRHPVKAPLWAAAPQFHFLELQQQQQQQHSPVAEAAASSGCVEEIPTRRVDVARGELLPSGTYWDPFMAPSAHHPAAAAIA